MDERHNSRRNAGRPEADKIKLTVVCFVEVSPNTIPKHDRSLWSELEKNNLIKQVEISKTDNVSEKIRIEFNLNQEWKLYNVKSGKPIEVKDEINFKSVKSNMTKKNRRLYIGPATYDIIDGTSTNDVSNRSSRSHINGSPVANTSTTENVIDRSHINGSPIANTSTTKNVINRSHTNRLPVDSCDPNSRYFDAELPDIGPSEPTESSDTEPSHNPLNFINGGSINRNINGNYANTFANGNVNNQSSRGHTDELSDRLVLRGVKYSLVQADLSQVNELPLYVSNLTIGDVSYLILPTNDSLYCSTNIENRNTNSLILRGVKYILVRMDPNHTNNLPTYTSTLMIYGVSYLVLPKTIPTNNFVSNSTSGGLPVTLGVSNNQSIHISTNEGFQSPVTSTSFINNIGSVNAATCVDINSGCNPGLFLNNNNNTQSYYTNQFSESANNVQRIADYEEEDDEIIRNFIVNGDPYPFYNNYRFSPN